jgi:hypothetical protein
MSAEAHRWRCSCCDEEHTGLPMAMGFQGPDNWENLDEATRTASSLDSDFCEIVRSNGEIERYICALLRLPVSEIGAEFQFVVWVSVSERSWNIYRAGYGGGTYEAEGCFGFLCNSLPDFELKSGLPANVWFLPDGHRPVVELQDAAHPLVDAQRSGIPASQIERWASIMHRG